MKRASGDRQGAHPSAGSGWAPARTALPSLCALLFLGATTLAQGTAIWTPGFGPNDPYLPNPSSESPVLDIAFGRLMIGGNFSTIGGIESTRLVAWTGHEYVGLPGPDHPSGGDVLATCEFDDGSGPALFVGGKFTSVGSVAARGLAKWTLAGWSQVGPPLLPFALSIPSAVHALLPYTDAAGPALAIGGFLKLADGTVTAVARWDGTSLTPLGPPISGRVTALCTHDDGSGPKLYAAGLVTDAGGLPANNVIRWNGTSWETVGQGLPGNSGAVAVWTMTTFDDGTGAALYAAGAFAASGPDPASCLARFRNGSWTRLGPNIAALVKSMAVFDDGAGPALYLGGVIHAIGSTPVPSLIVRFDGSGFVPFGAVPPPQNPLAGPPAYAAQSLEVFDAGEGAKLYVAYGTGIRRFEGTTPVELPHQPIEGHTSVLRGVEVLASWPARDRWAVTESNAASTRFFRDTGAGWTPASNGLYFETSPPFTGISTDTRGLRSAATPAGTDLRAFGRLRAYAQILPSPCYGWFPFARWSGSSWQVDQTLCGVPNAMEFLDLGSGPQWVGVGEFWPPVPGATVSVVAEQSGLWVPVAPWVPGPGRVSTAAVFDSGTGGELYLAGSFPSFAGVPAASIVRRVGAAFVPAGLGLSTASGAANVTKLAALDEGTGPLLYAAGDFTLAGGLPAAGIAAWDGAAWIPRATSMAGFPNTPPEVHDVAVFDDGTGPALYIIGKFSSVDGVPAEVIARYRGSSWSAVDGGLRYSASGGSGKFCKVIEDGFEVLYASGPFSHANGQLATGFARLARPRPGIALSQPAGPGSGVLVKSFGLVPGREYYNFFSGDSCGTSGSGPYLGLCASDPAPLLIQVQSPLGTHPFHFRAESTTRHFGPYAVGSGLTVECIAVDVAGGTLNAVSPVTRYTTN